MKKFFIPAAIVLIVVSFIVALQYGDLEPVTFATSLELADNKSESDITNNIVIEGEVIISEEYPYSKDGKLLSFYMRDSAGEIFRVSYDGQKEHEVRGGQRIRITGHAHGGRDAYFHGKQIFFD